MFLVVVVICTLLSAKHFAIYSQVGAFQLIDLWLKYVFMTHSLQWGAPCENLSSIGDVKDLVSNR